MLLESEISANSADFARKYEANLRLSEDLKSLVQKIREGGSQDARKKHEQRGKLFVRERIRLLLDPDRPFQQA